MAIKTIKISKKIQTESGSVAKRGELTSLLLISLFFKKTKKEVVS